MEGMEWLPDWEMMKSYRMSLLIRIESIFPLSFYPYDQVKVMRMYEPSLKSMEYSLPSDYYYYYNRSSQNLDHIFLQSRAQRLMNGHW